MKITLLAPSYADEQNLNEAFLIQLGFRFWPERSFPGGSTPAGMWSSGLSWTIFTEGWTEAEMRLWQSMVVDTNMWTVDVSEDFFTKIAGS